MACVKWLVCTEQVPATHCTHQAQSHSDPGRENMLVCDLSSVKVETQTCSYIGQFTDLEEPVFLCHQINIKFLNVNYL